MRYSKHACFNKNRELHEAYPQNLTVVLIYVNKLSLSLAHLRVFLKIVNHILI